nr:hypothetical protein [Microlunatus antarcticus]
MNIFGIGFGLAGLATAWRVAVRFDLAPHEVSDVLFAIAALAWLASCIVYLRYALSVRGALGRDLRDMTAGPFASLAFITPVLLAAGGIAPYFQVTATVVIDVLVVGIVLLGAWLTSFWMRGGTDIDRLHPGYFLPTVAGGLVASAGAAEFGQALLAEVMLGLGLVCWVIIGPMIVAR